ncbi:MAG TPA: iron ABC transporter permease [Burkholderiaceae bacterium]|nr:iron ABC transporter permease [Burkholderiaceae bacterium]
MTRAIRIWLVLAALATAALALALAVGSHAIAPPELLRALLRPDGGVDAQIVHELRLPRALAAFGTGGLLALAGALMQVLLRNPLADPYVMGASGGAAVGALAAMLFGLGAAFTQGAAFAGALASTALVFALARREFAGAALTDPGLGAPRLLLAGVMLAALWTALVTLLLTLSPEARIRGMLFWLAGDVSAGSGGAAALGVLVLLVVLAWPLGRSLNVMLRGPVIALSLGVRVLALRRALFVLASLATAVAMTSSGAVGFVGLVVPHALRLAIGNDQRVLLPACALGGGTLLLLADTAARTLVAPQQLPVGLLTALLGVPTFLALLLGRTR